MSDQPSSISSATLDALRSDRAALEAARTAAAEATGAASNALRAGERVDPIAVVAVGAYTASLDALALRLTDLAGPTPATVPGIDTALEQLARAIVTADTAARLASLRWLTPALGVAVLDATLATLRDLVARVTTDDPPDGSVVGSLMALAELVDVAATGPLDQADLPLLARLQTRATDGLPAELVTLPVAVITGQVRATPPDDEPAVAAEKVIDEPAEAVIGPEPPEPLVPEPVPPALAPEPAPGANEQPVPAAISAVVAPLIGGRRFGLAAAIAHAAGWPAARAAALRIAALADVVTCEHGACAVRLDAECADADLAAIAGDSVSLRLVVPALVHAALVTGGPAVGAPLARLAPRLEPHLGAVAEQVGRHALNGAPMDGGVLGMLSDVGELEQRVSTAAKSARQRLRTRKLRFQPASRIANEWLNADNGLLGRLLSAAGNDQRDRLGEVSAEVTRLKHRGELGRELDRADRRRGEPHRLDGRIRHELLTIAEDAIEAVSGWLAALSALRSKTRPGWAYAAAEITQMRHSLFQHTGPAMEALGDHANHPDGLAAAAAAAARDPLSGLAALLDSSSRPTGPEPPPERVLTVELLRVVGAKVDTATGGVTVPAGTSITALLAAAECDWQTAFDAQLGHEHYPTARYILSLAQAGDLPRLDRPLADDAAEVLAAAERQSLSELAAVHADLLARLSRARLEQEVSEERHDDLTQRLAATDPASRTDLAAVRAELHEAGQLLTSERETAAQRLRARLDSLLAGPCRISVDQARIGRLIDEGRLATAEELIYFCEIGEPVPYRCRQTDLAGFLTVVDHLPAGITSATVQATRDGEPVAGCSALDFRDLSPDDRETTARALDLWRQAGATAPDRRARLDVREHLLPALRLIGYQSTPSTKAQVLDLPKSPERRFVDVAELGWNGQALVPQFGSSLRGRLRVLLSWGQPDIARLLSWVDQDTSGDPVLVAYFGTISSAARREFASQAVGRQPVAVLDDAALAYLAAQGGRRLDQTMPILLPFSAVQPYVREKRSLVAPEMFYGRDAERKQVLATEGTQVIYGGRGLGKSALLRSAKAAFEREPGRLAVYLELTTGDIGPECQAAEAVWDMLLRELEGVEVVAAGEPGRNGNPYQAVRAGVREWLAADRQRRLLVLLDEADGFFDADAPRFVETNRLKGLGLLPGVEGRAKVVFAGLHSVQRFARVSNNTFKHLAQQPTPVGPLRPQSAYDLITVPTATLGFRFETDDLVHRILGYCSYQPFLLQIFTERLVRHMHEQRASANRAAGPPFTIARTDMAEVESDPHLQAEIRSTFHDTLHLDARYYVIANALAQHAYEDGPDTRLSEAELREDCRYWWPAGFEQLHGEAFRSYLQEMVGLGVLAPNADLRGWRLRSTNVLRMIGTESQVWEQLMEAPSAAVPPQSIPLMVRRPLADGRLAPLTAAQVEDLLGDRSNQVRLVLGSTATGITEVTPTLHAACADLGDRYELVVGRRSGAFKEALTGARPGQRRVVLRDLVAAGATIEECLASVAMALGTCPTTPGASRSVVLVSGTDQLAFWQRVLANHQPPGFGTVVLRRYDRASLRVWALDTGRFKSTERQARLLEVTGGWPVLVDQATALATTTGSEDEALATLAGELSTPERAHDLLVRVGLTTDRTLATTFDGLTELAGADGSSRDELVVAAEAAAHPDPATAVAILETLGMFDQTESGDYLVEPVVAQCWRRARPVAADG